VGTPVLLLDLDRTLIDLQSFTDYSSAFEDVRAILGEWPGVDVPDTDWDRPTQACMTVLHALLGDPRWLEISEVIAVHERAAIADAVVMPTVAGVLGLLRPVPVAVVTLLHPDVAHDVLVMHGIGVGAGEPVDLVVGRDPWIRPKPWPDGLLAACERLDVDPGRATMVGDSSWDEEAASTAGASFIGVPSSPASFAPGISQAPTFAAAIQRVLDP
jgi:phosphoglycolate phosphatase-like HAD superfamily hydrolase